MKAISAGVDIPAEDLVAVRKATEALDDLDIRASVTPQGAAAIGISWQGVEQRYRAPLVSNVLAVMERHIKE